MRRFGRRAALAALITLGLCAGATAQPAQAQMLCGMPLMPACAPSSSPSPSAPPCPVGTADANPGDLPVAPRLGERLAPLRSDGRLPWGFVEPSFGSSTGASVAHRLYRNAGANVARLVLDWGAIEREDGGFLRWSDTDAGYCAALAAGARPLLTLFGVPRWALEPGASCHSTSMSCRAAPSREAYDELRRFAEAAAIRYPSAVGIEVWNEPNADSFWWRPDPARYVELLREVYTGVKNGRPSMPVIGGGLANHQSDLANGSIGIYNFVEAMYALGAGELMDGLSFHPYPVNPIGGEYDYFTRTIDGVRAIVEREEGQGTRRLWLTELGAVMQSRGVGGSAPFDGPGQARQLMAAYDAAAAMPDVDVITFFRPADVAGEPAWGWAAKDLLGRLMPRPVLCRFAGTFGRGMDCSKPV